MDLSDIIKIVLLSQVSSGAASETGKKLVHVFAEVGGRALSKFEEDCRTVQIVRSVIDERTRSFSRFLGAGIDRLVGNFPTGKSPMEEPENLLLYADAVRAAVKSDSDEKIAILSDLVLEKLGHDVRDSHSMSIANAIDAAGRLSTASIKACAMRHLFMFEENVRGVQGMIKGMVYDEKIQLMMEAWSPIVPILFSPDIPRLTSFDFEPLISSRCAIPESKSWSNRGLLDPWFLLYPEVRSTFDVMRQVRHMCGSIELTDIGKILGRAAFGRLTSYSIDMDLAKAEPQFNHIPFKLTPIDHHMKK